MCSGYARLSLLGGSSRVDLGCPARIGLDHNDAGRELVRLLGRGGGRQEVV